MNFFVFLLILDNIEPAQSQLIRIVQTSDRALPLHSTAGRVEVAGVGLSDHEDLSLCVRLMTHQFSPVVYNYQGIIFLDPLRVLGSYATISSGSEVIDERYRQIHRESWQTGQTYGRSLSSSFPSWTPGTWNSVCVTLSARQNLHRTFLNGDLVAEDPAYPGLHRNSTGSVVLMNAMEEEYGLVYPMFGSVSDLQVWSRALSRRTVTLWSSCQLEDPGDLISWHQATLRITDLELVEMEKSKICGEKGQQIVAFEEMRTYLGGRSFCISLGGDMAVAENISQLGEMRKSFLETNCSRGFYTGFTDRETEGVWRSETSGQEISSIKWRSGQPDDSLGVEDCAFYSVDTGELVDHSCSRTFCPVCSLDTAAHFQLRGACLNLADTLYLMVNSSFFLGYINTKLVRSADTGQWQLLSTFNNSLIASMVITDDSKDMSFPLGTNHWHFPDLNCTDNGTEWRRLKLHRRVDLPGTFCCDDGLCLHSDKVCDLNQHCSDGTDERDCRIIQLPDFPYDKDRAPTETDREEGEIIFKTNQVNVTLKVIDILDINEDKSLLHLFFKIELTWFDSNLNYRFLNMFEDKNNINEDLAGKIWSPNLEFIHTVDETARILGKKFRILRKSEPLLVGDTDTIHPSETYSGATNPLSLMNVREGRFICSFANIENFPFGDQVSVLFSDLILIPKQDWKPLVANNV